MKEGRRKRINQGERGKREGRKQEVNINYDRGRELKRDDTRNNL